jgi:hypothetical protein
MPTAPDASTLAENLACHIAGLTPQKRRDWVKKGLLDQVSTSARLTELQVVQLALVRELHDVLGARDAGVVWIELRKQLEARLPVGRLDVVVDLGYREVTLVSVQEDLVQAVRTGRAICVIPIDDLITRVREAFRRLAEAPKGSGSTSASARGKSGASSA